MWYHLGGWVNYYKGVIAIKSSNIYIYGEGEGRELTSVIIQWVKPACPVSRQLRLALLNEGITRANARPAE